MDVVGEIPDEFALLRRESAQIGDSRFPGDASTRWTHC